MKFFKYFPQTFDIDARLITNITKKVLINKNLLDESVLYQTYKLKEDERLETLAFRLYNDESLQWVLALVNNMLDPRTEMPLSQFEMSELLKEKYGSVENAVSTPHHYEDEDGNWVNADQIPNTVVYCDQWEDLNNEQRREIKIVRKEYIDLFVTELKRVMANK